MTELFQSRRPWSSHPRKGKPELNNDATRLIPLMRLMPASFPFRVWHPTEDESLCKELLKVGKVCVVVHGCSMWMSVVRCICS